MFSPIKCCLKRNRLYGVQMNTLIRMHYIAGVAIAAIAITGLSTDSKAAAKKTTSRVTEKTKSAREAPERNAQEMAAEQAAKKLTPTQKSKMLVLLNDGATNELEAIRGIGKIRAAALAKARPFKSISQLINVRGIGGAVYSDLLTHAKSLTMRGASSPNSKKSSSGSKRKPTSSKRKSQ